MVKVSTRWMAAFCLVAKGRGFSLNNVAAALTTRRFTRLTSPLAMSSSNPTLIALSWSELQDQIGQTAVGAALDRESALRSLGNGSAHVQNRLRKFNSDDEPAITFFRDHAGWCPYCQKTMLLIEEKEIPIKIDLVPMRSYGDKPREFLQKVPSGLLPAIEVNGKIVTESQVIMDLLDRWHPKEDGYKPMMPDETDEAGRARYTMLARLERELFSWWCTLVFRPEGPLQSGGNLLSNLFGGGEKLSPSMQGFLECIQKVDQNLLATKGPWFFDEYDYPTMIDFVYVSHVERMLASCAYWKGLNLRDPQWKLTGLNRWLEAFEKRESYLAFKSDYYTHVKDIPPQYGPGCDGGFASARDRFQRDILGRDGESWHLPLSHDDSLQPLYLGLPLPLCVLQAAGIKPDDDKSGSYRLSDPKTMAMACRTMAAWKVASNGNNVAKFAARGGPKGAKNVRKSFQAELADPYAESDLLVQPAVDAALRVICTALLTPDQTNDDSVSSSKELAARLQAVVTDDQSSAVTSSLIYLRDRIGVPRDLPLASARYLRAYLNWGIDALK